MSAQPAPDLRRDPRYMAVLATLSRHGVRLSPDRMTRLVADVLDAVGTAPPPPPPDPEPAPEPDQPEDGRRVWRKASPDWRPKAGYAKQERVKAKNPAPGMRVCSICRQTLPLDRFGVYRDRNGNTTPKPRCRECLNEYQRNRYLTARKMAGALNKARLEFVADDDVAGIRCLECGGVIVSGDEVAAETGLRHLACAGNNP